MRAVDINCQVPYKEVSIIIMVVQQDHCTHTVRVGCLILSYKADDECSVFWPSASRPSTPNRFESSQSIRIPPLSVIKMFPALISRCSTLALMTASSWPNNARSEWLVGQVHKNAYCALHPICYIALRVLMGNSSATARLCPTPVDSGTSLLLVLQAQGLSW